MEKIGDGFHLGVVGAVCTPVLGRNSGWIYGSCEGVEQIHPHGGEKLGGENIGVNTPGPGACTGRLRQDVSGSFSPHDEIAGRLRLFEPP